MTARSPEAVSDLIATLYDCAIDPDRWPEAMQRLAAAFRCMDGLLSLVDLETSRLELLSSWNHDPRWAEYLERETADAFRRATTLFVQPIDEPVALARIEPFRSRTDAPEYVEVARPLGICDGMLTIVLRESQRLGIFVANRHESVGPISDDDLAAMRLIAPHIRRAVTISDLLDLKALHAQALADTLDSLAAGVIVVAEDNRILHANAAARRMLAAGEVVRSQRGRLSAATAAAGDELATAIELAQRDESDIGTTGIGVALGGPARKAAVAHVLPLARGALRTRLVPQAAAAVFVTQPPLTFRPADVTTVAASLRLTPAETRTLGHIVGGATLVEAARAAGVAETTARTHLQGIFAKAGVARQSELIALVARLMPPVHRPADDA